MNIYDTANRLAQEIRQSEEYMNYKMAKEVRIVMEVNGEQSNVVTPVSDYLTVQSLFHP